MNKSQKQDIQYDTSEFEELSQCLIDVKIGYEESHFQKQTLTPKDSSIQKNADLLKAKREDLEIKLMLFGIGSQYDPTGASLDKKYPGHITHQIREDNMMPLLLPKTDVRLKLCKTFKSGQICFYTYRGEEFCHRLFIEQGKYRAVSLNKKYEALLLDPYDFHLVGTILSVHFPINGYEVQHDPQNHSLDVKYPGSINYELTTDHMLPWLPPKTVLRVKFSKTFKSGQICVFRYKGENYCNKIFIEGVRFKITSFNSKYKPIYLKPKEFFLVGIILSVHFSVEGLE